MTKQLQQSRPVSPTAGPGYSSRGTTAAAVPAESYQQSPGNTGGELCAPPTACRLPLTPDPGQRRIKSPVPRVRGRIPRVLRDALGACTAGVKGWPLFVFGPPGCGKTAAGLYLADRTIGSRRFVRFGDFVDEYREVKLGRFEFTGTHGAYTPADADYWRWVTGWRLAVIDDVAAGKVTDHGVDTLLQLLDARFARPTVLTSNLDPDEIAITFDARIASRIAAGTIVDLSGLPDQRMEDPAEAS